MSASVTDSHGSACVIWMGGAGAPAVIVVGDPGGVSGEPGVADGCAAEDAPVWVPDEAPEPPASIDARAPLAGRSVTGLSRPVRSATNPTAAHATSATT